MNIPRQPFVGLALMAALGIVVADFFPIAVSRWWFAAIAFALLAIPLFSWPKLTSTYLLVGCGFFLLHNFRIGDPAGLQLAADLSDRPRVVNAVGFVTSEPKVAPNGFATFLFKLESIEFDGKNDDGEAFPEMGDGAHHSAFAFLCGGHRTSRFQHSRRGYEPDSAWRFFLRTKSFRAQQSGRRDVFSSLLGHERIFLDRISTFVRGRRRNHFIGRSAFRMASTDWRA